MKNITNILLGILVLVVVFGIFKSHSLDLNVSEHKNNIITITGKAEKEVVPDVANISFAINEYKKSQKEAANIVNKKVKKIIDALEDLDIDEKDIKTNRYSVYPEYDWNNGKRTFRNYRVSQNVEVKIKDLEKVSKVLAKVVELKVDNLNGPNFVVDKIDDIRDELREEAIEDAKTKAGELASQLGVSLNKIVGFSESGSSNYWRPQPMYKSVALSVAPMEDAVAEPEIKPGQEKITKSISISFQIED